MRTMPAAAILLACCLLAAPTAAQEELPRLEPDKSGGFTFALENDLFAGRDDGYTNGIRFSYISPEDELPYWLTSTISNLPLLSKNSHKRWHFELGQSMFAPENLTLRSLQRDDRPYAGWLYSSIGVISDTGTQLDNLQLTLGMVGPASAAAETQKIVHKIVGSPIPQGWKNQLDNEPGVVLTYERKWRSIYQETPAGLGFDITPSVGGSIGNIYTHAAAAIVARVGYDLPSDYGPSLISPNLPGSDFFIPTRNIGWYIFAGLESRAVVRNIFLDGNSFRDSHSVDKNTFVSGAQAGIAFTLGNARLAYTHVLRTREFDDQSGDQFGALTLSIRY